MKKLHYIITTLEPLIITQHSDDPNMYETLQYIRGTVIQGVFAQSYLKDRDADTDFTRLIVGGDCTFSNAFPIEREIVFTPAPAALVREKYNPSKAHNLFVQSDDVQTKGISSLVSIQSNIISALTIRKEIRLHNEIKDDTRISEDGKLFNYQSLPSDMEFKGSITLLDDNDEDTIKGLILNDSKLRIGRSATSEYGKVNFRWSDEKAVEDKKVEGKVVMTMLSDTIVYNDNGFSSLVANDINPFLKNSSIERTISRKSRIEGFLNVWKLRKPSENVFAAGSSFLLDKLPDNSDELENMGLGERTHEGYGQVLFAMYSATVDGFDYHELGNPKYPHLEEEEMPDLTDRILRSIRSNRAKEKVISKALDDAENTIPKITSNHLLGKLKDMPFDETKFNNYLDDLRAPAKKHLENSYIGNKSLVEHLKEVISGSYCNEQKALYLIQYFNQLRRLNIQKEQEDEKR